MTLLIARDTYFRTMVRRLLEVRQHAVLAADSWTEALRLANGRPVGVALVELDQSQPDPREEAQPFGPGREVAPIVYLAPKLPTASTLSRSAVGVVLRKPFSPAELEQAIDSARNGNTRHPGSTSPRDG